MSTLQVSGLRRRTASLTYSVSTHAQLSDYRRIMEGDDAPPSKGSRPIISRGCGHDPFYGSNSVMGGLLAGVHFGVTEGLSVSGLQCPPISGTRPVKNFEHVSLSLRSGLKKETDPDSVSFSKLHTGPVPICRRSWAHCNVSSFLLRHPNSIEIRMCKCIDTIICVGLMKIPSSQRIQKL